MRQFLVTLQSLTPYSQGRIHRTEKLPRETADKYEERTYLQRLHVNPAGNIFMPAMGFKGCLENTAAYVKEQIPGKGKETYTKNFLRGVICPEDLELDLTPDKTVPHWVFVPADGRRGSGKRVWKCFPRIDAWAGVVPFVMIDDILTREVFERHMRLAGQITGLGVWRPQNGGMWGKFSVEEIVEVSL